MIPNMDISAQIAEVVALVQANSTRPSDDQFFDVVNAIKQLPEIEVIGGPAFRYREFEIWTGLSIYASKHIDALAAIERFSLVAAPSLVSRLPISEGHEVIISRYAACAGERLARVETTTGPFREAAARQFRTDMQTLIEHGLVHPFVRGPHHWLVSSETGTLVLDSWYALRACNPQEGIWMLEAVDRQLAERSAGAATTTTPPVGGPARTPATSRIEEVFGCARVLLPVVHPVDQETAMASVQVAHDAGVKGIFLINQGMTADQVLALVRVVRARFPALWVGLNLLGVPPARVLARGLAACDGRVDGIWSDNAHIEEDAAQPAAQAFVDARQAHGWTGLYFGGVAFKYQREVAAGNLGRAAAAALPFMDVICTSGPGTGQPAQVDKVIAMRAGIGRRGALALASGVTDDNVDGYLPHVDAFLVGTGLEHGFGVLDPGKVARLQQRIAAYAATT